MILYIASDHAGFDLKNHILKALNATPDILKLNIAIRDLGPASSDRVDYPDFAQSLCRELIINSSKNPESNAGLGILICGSGQGMAIAANRFRGIRAALAWSEESARLSREHNDANVLCLGARLIDHTLAVNLVKIFLRRRLKVVVTRLESRKLKKTFRSLQPAV